MDSSTRYIIHLAADHAGFELKQKIAEWFLLYPLQGVLVVDHGAKSYDAEDDYPDTIALAAEAVARAPHRDRALLFGGSGQGEAMLANRYPGVRATVYYGGDPRIIRLSREHNDANVLSFGARFVTFDEIASLISEWLATSPLSDEKYARRIRKAEHLSKNKII